MSRRLGVIKELHKGNLEDNKTPGNCKCQVQDTNLPKADYFFLIQARMVMQKLTG